MTAAGNTAIRGGMEALIRWILVGTENRQPDKYTDTIIERLYGDDEARQDVGRVI